MGLTVSVSVCYNRWYMSYLSKNVQKSKMFLKKMFVDICHRIMSLRKLYYATLTYFLKVKNFNFYISEMVRASAKM